MRDFHNFWKTILREEFQGSKTNQINCPNWSQNSLAILSYLLDLFRSLVRWENAEFRMQKSLNLKIAKFKENYFSLLHNVSEYFLLWIELYHQENRQA